MRLEHLLFAHAQRDPERTAVVCGGRRLSYAALAERVKASACGLRRRGVRPGDRVALCLSNGIPFVELFYAALAAGASVVPVNMRLAPPEVEFILADAQPKVVLRAFEPDVPCRRQEIEAVPNDDCVILYTSGTTGRPKGAVNTHVNVVTQNVEHHVDRWGIGSRDCFLATTPLAHRAGIARMVNALGLGGTLIVMERFDAEEALAVIEREAVTVAGLPPTVLRFMLPALRRAPERCAALRRIVVSAEAFPMGLLEEVSRVLPHAECHAVYGMSEAAVSSASQAEMLARPGTVGRPYPGVETKIENDELLVRGAAAVMKGYFNNPVANAESFADGWFRTGDLARRDAEGYLYILDRKKDMVVSGGYNVYSKELEQVLVQHPAIEDAAVIGVPDDVYGEAVAAFIQLRPKASLRAEEVVEHCRARLAGYKKPRHVVFVDTLPRNALGKVVKAQLRIRMPPTRCPRPEDR